MRRIKMSPVCQLEMTLLGDFRGVSGVTVRLMSDGELSRLEVPMDPDQRLLTTEPAGRLPGLRRASPRSRSFAGVNTRRRRSENTGIQVSCPRLSPVDKNGRRKGRRVMSKGLRWASALVVIAALAAPAE